MPPSLTTLNLESAPAPRLRRPWEVLDEEVFPELTADLVFGRLRGGRVKGSRLESCCPIHNGDEPNAFVVNTERLEWICFLGCGGGGPVQFLQKTQSMGWLESAQALAVLAGVDPSKLQLWGQHWTEKDFERHAQIEMRSALLGIFMDWARVRLVSDAGKSLRGYLESRHGLSEQGVRWLRLGLYTTPEDVFPFLKKTGLDLEELKSKGFFDSTWTGRLVAPWQDLSGRTVNLWSWNPTANLLDSKTSRLGEPLFDRDYLGSQQTPFQLYRIRQQEEKELILLDDPLQAILCAGLGVRDPLPIACCGKIVKEQVDVLSRTLATSGSLTVLTAQDPENPDLAAAAKRNLKALENAPFPVFAAEPQLPAEGEAKKTVRPSDFVKARGAEAFLEALKQSEVMISSADDPAQGGSWTGLGRMFKGLTRRGDDFQESGRDSRRGGGQTAFLAMIMHAAEEVGQRIAQGFLRALPGGFAGSAQGELPSVEAPLQLPGREKDQSPPPVFSVDRLEDASESISPAKPSGWRDLDELGIRFRPGELALIGGRAGHGRTSVLVGLLVYWLYRTRERLVLISYDESEVQIYHRLLSLLTSVAGRGLPLNVIRNQFGKSPHDTQIDSAEFEVLDTARECLRGWENRLHVAYRPAWSSVDIDRHLRELAAEEPLGGVLIDPLDKVLPGGGVGETSFSAARWLKSLAVELSCCMVASVKTEKLKPARLKKKDRKRAEGASAGMDAPSVLQAIRKRRPRLADFSDELEQEADLILALLSHAAVFSSLSLGTPPEMSTLEMGVLKNRAGPTGDWVRLIFERPCCLLRDSDDLVGLA